MSEPGYLSRTRSAYDRVAVDYAELLQDAMETMPYDRAMLGVFAEAVAPGAAVVDVGCGPGRITGYLDGLGLNVSGVDLSPGMVAEARRRCPQVRFTEGTMTDLDLADRSVGGLVAWYSIIHVPPASHPQIFTEFARVLQPNAPLLLAFQVGDECRHLQQGYGHRIDLDAYRLPPERIAGQLEAAGLIVESQLVRAPVAPESTPQAYLLARRSAPMSPWCD